MLVLALGGPAAGADDDASVRGWWLFDDAKGRGAPDASGRGNDLRVADGRLVKGVRGAALEFNGRTTTAGCPASGGLNPTDAISIEAWIKPADVTFGGMPAVVRADGAYALRFSGKRLGFLLWMDGRLLFLNSKKTDWQAGRWYHLAATYDGQRMRLFVDGKADGVSERKLSGKIDRAGGLCGVGSVGARYRFSGAIDEVRILSRALSGEEIRAAHAAGRKSLDAQKDAPFTPRPLGDKPTVFRKPPRDVREVVRGFLWVDAEDFADYGGWTLDTQFVYLMGSAYLIASSVGAPVADATTTVNVPRDGKWRVWVRARNWLKGHSPGRFTVAINGQATKRLFGGAAGEKWVWEDGGVVELKRGKTQLALQDRTGYFARCDAIVLTADLDYRPPADVEAIRRERARLTGLSLEPRDGGTYDVIVVGGGSAGCPAAIAAARLGAKTAMIQNRPVLGGNASTEMGVPINGAAVAHPNARESGIIEEAGRIGVRYGHRKMSEPFRILMDREKTLSTFLNQHVFAVEMADKKRIAAVKAVDTLTGRVTTYRAKLFIDCTGDGWVGYYAGATYRLGRESRDEYNESLAPAKADTITMSGCLMGNLALSFRAVNTGKPVDYTPPPWAAKLPGAGEFGRRVRGITRGNWWLEHPGTIDDLYNAERARDELVRISFGYWNYLKNDWPDRRTARCYRLQYIPIHNAKRETRRLIGDYVLNQNDVQSARVFDDRISYGGWSLDVHHPRGIFSGKDGPFDFNPPVPLYTIPYRSLYSVNIDNLLFAGRCASVSHVALGTVRVQGTLATLGQAAGTAAAMCIRHNTTPRDIHRRRLTELQQTLLKHDQYIPQLRNADPADLARAAKVVASSTAGCDTFGLAHVKLIDTIHPLNTPRAVMVPRGLNAHWKAVRLRLASDNATPTPVRLHVRGGKRFGDFSSRSDLAVVTATVPPKREGMVKFELDRRFEAPFVWFWLEPAEGVSWRLMARGLPGSCRAYGGDRSKWTVSPSQQYAIAVDPPLAVPADYAESNATNGYARVVGKASNLWASDAARPLPQWLQLEFKAPTRVNTVYLTFDTNMNSRMRDVGMPPQCVSDYDLSYHDGQAWRVLARVRGNFQRRRTHRFDTIATTRLRLTVRATHGSPSARLFEIRAYHEEP